MSFEKKDWKDRIAEFINRRRLTYEDGRTELVEVARDEGNISQEGDAFNAENMNDLEERVAEEFKKVVAKTDIIDNLESTETEKPLSAKQGRILNEGLIELKSGSCGVVVSLDINETYICPSDGYVRICNGYNEIGYVTLYSSNDILFGYLRPSCSIQDSNSHDTCFVKKGTKIVTGVNTFSFCEFHPLI